MTIDSIVWPSKPKEAIEFYLKFQLTILRNFGVNFDGYFMDPIKVTEAYLDSKISKEEYCNGVEKWWSYLDDNEKLRDFQKKESLMARLAICLLGVKEEEVDELGEQLSWFLEVVGFLGLKNKKVFKIFDAYFTFRD